MTLDAANARIKENRQMVETGTMYLPSEREESIIELVTKETPIIKRNTSIIKGKSTLELEFDKVDENLLHYFSDKSLIERYRKMVFSRAHITRSKSEVYLTNFNCTEDIGLEPNELIVPKELNNLSHNRIGHEIMHVLKDSYNEKETSYHFLYGEVISMLYELIQAEDEESSIREHLINFRLLAIHTSNSWINQKQLLKRLGKDEEKIMYYQLIFKPYLISFYYTICLYEIYLNNPKELLRLVRCVLRHEMTTFDMLNNLGLIDNISQETYQRGCKLLLTK